MSVYTLEISLCLKLQLLCSTQTTEPSVLLLPEKEERHREDNRHTQGRGHISAFSTFVWLKGPFLLFQKGCCVDNIHPDTSELATQVLFVVVKQKGSLTALETTLPTIQQERPRGNIKAGLLSGFVVYGVRETDTVQENEEKNVTRLSSNTTANKSKKLTG